jgi:hypothetical protein
MMISNGVAKVADVGTTDQQNGLKMHAENLIVP